MTTSQKTTQSTGTPEPARNALWWLVGIGLLGLFTITTANVWTLSWMESEAAISITFAVAAVIFIVWLSYRVRLLLAAIVLALLPLCPQGIWIQNWLDSEPTITLTLVIAGILFFVWIARFCFKLREDQGQTSTALWSPSARQLRIISLGVFSFGTLIFWASLLYQPGVDIRDQVNTIHKSLNGTLIHPITVTYPKQLRYSHDVNDRQLLIFEFGSSTSAASALPSASTAATITLLADPPGSFIAFDDEHQAAQPQITLRPGAAAGQTIRTIQLVPRDDTLGRSITMTLEIEGPGSTTPVTDTIAFETQTAFARTMQSINSHALGDVGLVFGSVLAVIGLMLELRKSAKDSIEAEQEEKKQRMIQRLQDIEQLIAKEPFTAIEQIELCRQEQSLVEMMPDQIERIEKNIQRGLMSREIAGQVLREVGRRLRSSNGSEENQIRQWLGSYTFPDISGRILPAEHEINTHFVLKLFEKYSEDARNLCVQLIKSRQLKLVDKILVSGYAIFADSEIIRERLLVQVDQGTSISYAHLLAGFTQSRITGLARSIQYIELAFLKTFNIAETFEIEVKRHIDNINKFRSESSIEETSLDLLAVSEHIVLIEDLISWNAFESRICDVQRKEQYSAWSVCITPDIFATAEPVSITRFDVLQDIVWAIAESWLDLLADKPMAFFALPPDAQTELGRMLRWRITTREALGLELEGRGILQTSGQYAEIQRRFSAIYTKRSTTPTL
jgi:hypothetical protein